MNRPYVVAALAAAIPAAWLLVTLVLYVRADAYRRRSMRMRWRINWTWPKLSTGLGLTFLDASPIAPRVRSARHLGMEKRYPVSKGRPRRPQLRRLKVDPFGVSGYATTLPKVGLTEWQKAAPYLADAWGAVRVTVGQSRPGRVDFRAIHRDPLAEATTWTPTGAEPTEEDFRTWSIGDDEYAQPARLRIANTPGMVLAGIPGSGKTSLLGGQLLARYAPSKRVAFIGMDGKDGEDLEEWAPRFAAYIKDDLDEALDLWRRIDRLRKDRQRTISLPVDQGGLGVKNFWNAGPTEAWPWVVVLVDEAGTYLREWKGNDPETKRRAGITAEIRILAEDVVKKCRSVGIFVVFATQKPTTDSLPSAIRDVCPLAASFSQTTMAAAVAALGDDIREHPDASPTNLQGSTFIGAMTTKVEGVPGFVRVRSPFVDEADQLSIAEQVADLRVDPWALLPSSPRLSVVRDETQATAS